MKALQEKCRRGSVLLIVLITILFATVALTLFIERASTDLLVDAREIDSSRLRLEAYSALETTLGVLEDFRLVIGALHNPAEGWGTPLEFAGYYPGEGRTVEVQFEDESAKISLPQATAATLTEVFKSWNLPQSDAQKLTDALYVWMQKDYVPSIASSPRAEDYERGELPVVPPARSLRSYSELASIEYVRQVLFDPRGIPNELYLRFVNAFSLYSYQKANINGGNADTLASLGISDDAQKKRVHDYLTGTGAYERQGAGFFKDSSEVTTLLGASTPAADLTTQISALRVIVTVHEGRSSYRLTAVVAPQGGAKLPPASASNSGNQRSRSGSNTAAATNSTSASTSSPSATAQRGNTSAQKKSLNYPFTILEIRENDQNPAAPAAASP